MSGARDRVAAVLGTAALTLAVLAVVPGAVLPGGGGAGGTGRPEGPLAVREPGGPGGVGVAELAEELASGDAVVAPLELASWIRDRRPVRVVDVRDSSAFIRFSVPTAEHARLRELPSLLADTRSGPVVLYDDGSGDAARAWLLLRRLGHAEARVLGGGVVGWIEAVIEPVLPAGTPAERARFDRVAELSRYFGGVPRVGERDPGRGDGPGRADAAVQLLSRRGCY